jgi:hypothetical protein
MKKILLLFVILNIVACGGYKAKKNPMSPEEVRIADLAQKIDNDAAPLADEAQPPHKDAISEFADRASRFHNACRRFGANSLEARSAFDRLFYQTSQVSSSLTKESDAALFEKWEKLRTEVVQLSEFLGYRPEKTE